MTERGLLELLSPHHTKIMLNLTEPCVQWWLWWWSLCEWCRPGLGCPQSDWDLASQLVSVRTDTTPQCCTHRTAPRVLRNPQTWRMISSRNSIEYWELCYVVTRGEEPDSGAAGNVHVHVEWWWCASLQSLHTDLHPTPTQPTLHLFIAKLFKILP